MDTWRLIHTFEAPAAFHMGLDQVMLEEATTPPTLRFYTWRPAALSLGYFQRLAEVGAASRAAAVVRRATGGGAIHHAGELTFSLACAQGLAPYRGALADSYRRVHRAIAAARSELGVRAALRGEGALASDRPGTGMCFHHSTALDLAWDGRKGVGSAQRRKAGRVLHHGSIKIAADPLEPGVARLDAYRAGLEPEELAGLLCEGFQRELGLVLEEAELSEVERERARERGAHFESPAFVGRR